ncbi:dienelactone hydrolase family protein [Burkholderia thailandensis H0587]|nr:dienelactone hydrolase family protein [Burkholderia thailandensis H0587]
MMPFNPVDHAAQLKAPTLGLYGGKDDSIPQSSLAQMRERLAAGAKAARDSEILVYPDAGHAFFADYRPSYVKADAEDGWKRAVAWFRHHGVM